MPTRSKGPRLKLLPIGTYRGVDSDDPIRYYYWPFFGHMYRRRVELCLAECRGGQRVLEIGFGTGVAFINLHEMYNEIHGLDLTASIEKVHSVFAALGIQTFLRNGNILDMPYPDNYFNTVLLISILEHLKPLELGQAFHELHRVLVSGGQILYGAPVERSFMTTMFRLLGYDIHQFHFSTEKQIAEAAGKVFKMVRITQMKSTPPLFGAVYEVGHFVKAIDKP